MAATWGRQLAIGAGRDAWTGVGMPITADEDGAQLDLIEEVAAVEAAEDD